jgi:hypothetical protein
MIVSLLMSELDASLPAGPPPDDAARTRSVDENTFGESAPIMVELC